MLDEGVDLLDQFLHHYRNEPRRIARWVIRAEPAFHLIELGGVSRRVVNLVSGPLRQPCAHL